MKRTNIVLSVKKEWLDLILSGKKSTELRKSAPKDFFKNTVRVSDGVSFVNVNYRFWLYSTKASGGSGKILGYVDCDEAIAGDPLKIAPRTAYTSKVSTSQFMDYFGMKDVLVNPDYKEKGEAPVWDTDNKCKIAFAYRLRYPVLFSQIKVFNGFNCEDGLSIGFFGLKSAPESWTYASLGLAEYDRSKEHGRRN